MGDTFIILRRDGHGYATRGPVAAGVTLRAAREEIVRLKKAYPHQDFVIMGEVGEVSRSEKVSVRIAPPALPARKPRRKARNERTEPEAPIVMDNTNIVPLRKEESA